MRHGTPRGRLQFDLRRLLFWIVPWAAILSAIFSSAPDPPLSLGNRPFVTITIKLIAAGIVTAIWSVLVLEDRRASPAGAKK